MTSYRTRVIVVIRYMRSRSSLLRTFCTSRRYCPLLRGEKRNRRSRAKGRWNSKRSSRMRHTLCRGALQNRISFRRRPFAQRMGSTLRRRTLWRTRHRTNLRLIRRTLTNTSRRDRHENGRSSSPPLAVITCRCKHRPLTRRRTCRRITGKGESRRHPLS